MDTDYLKALHIIFVITWFAGLFYIVRLFIYQTEAEKKPNPEKEILQTQYKIMSRRLWYMITWPSGVLTSVFAFWLLYTDWTYYLTQPWMLIKLSFVVVLFLYHFSCQKIYKQLQQDIVKYSSFKLRVWNEVATILLFAIVFLVVLKNSISWIWGVVGIITLGVLLMYGIKLYKRVRERVNKID